MGDIEGRDAAFARNIGNQYGGIVMGYHGGPNAFHVWSIQDWAAFPTNYKVPTWVAGYNGADEAPRSIATLKGLGISKKITVLDMEARVDASYVTAYGLLLQDAGYKVLVYGSRATVFRNPQLNGYLVADWTGQPHMAINPDTGSSLGIRGTQYLNDVSPGYDVTVWKEWVLEEMWR